jgi:type I restriction enzyme S subunit
MSKQLNSNLIPKYRFPNFKSDEGWQEKSLESIATFLKGKGISKADVVLNGNQPCIRYGELYTHYNEIIDTPISYTELPISELILSKANDVIIPSSGETQEDIATASCVLKDGIALGGDLNILRSNINGIFLAYNLTHIKKRAIAKLAQGNAVVHLYSSQLKKLIVNVPKSKDEQKQIASCLSSLDEVITVENQRLDILQNHKKGLIQNLLPQEGETVPKFRFKEFEDTGDWEETTLSQVADYENGKAHEQDITDVGEFIVVNSKFISQDGEVKKFTNTAFCPATKDDVLMVLSDIPNGRAIAKCFLVEEDNRYSVNQRICRITPRNLNSKILFYLLNRNPYFLAFDDGVKQTNLRKEDVLNCPLVIPNDPQEQEMIADTLSSIDDLINAQNQKLEGLQLHKKGLLQGLFPTINNEE